MAHFLNNKQKEEVWRIQKSIMKDFEPVRNCIGGVEKPPGFILIKL